MKKEFLNKLTEEELKLLDSITYSDIKKELKSRKPKTEAEIGDCFYTKEYSSIYLIKTTNFERDNWFTCDEIGINENGVDYYEASHYIDDFSDWEPLDASLYESISALINSREDAVDKVVEQFDNQIRKLCQELKQNQE